MEAKDKIKNIDCKNCKAKSTVKMTICAPTVDGVTVKINKCTNCGYAHTFDELLTNKGESRKK